MGATIREWTQKGKSLLASMLVGRSLDRDLFPALLLVTIGLVSFGLGRLSVETRPADTGGSLLSSVSVAGNDMSSASGPTSHDGDVKRTDDGGASIHAASRAGEAPSASTAEKKYVGSKNSSKYHLPWCSGAARIVEENKVWFSSKEEAEQAGYAPAANCKGI